MEISRLWTLWITVRTVGPPRRSYLQILPRDVRGQHNKTDATDAYALAALANDAGERLQSRKQPRRALRRDDLRELESIMAEAIAGDEEAARIDQLEGISTVAAATFMGEVQDIQNFESERKLASYAGLGLVRRQTGKTLNRNRAQLRSNRQLKLCIHNMALGRLFHHAKSKEYYDRKRSEGKNHKQALRALARHLLRLLYRTLQPPREAA